MPDERRIVTGDADGKMRAWDLSALDLPPAVLAEQPGPVNTLAISRDGKRIVTGAPDGRVRIWDVGAGTPAIESAPHPRGVSHVSYAPDERRVIGVANDRAWLWDGAAGAPGRQFEFEGVQSAAFSPHGERIVLAQANGKVVILDADARKAPITWQAHDRKVELAVFSPNGKRIVTAADDDTARVFDAETGAELAVLRGHGNHVASAAFASGTRIVTAAKDRSVAMWPAYELTQALIAHARAALPRRLTDEQRKEYFLDAPAGDKAQPAPQ